MGGSGLETDKCSSSGYEDLGDIDIKAEVHRDFSSLRAIAISMGRWHDHFARAVELYGGYIVDLIVDGKLAGQSVVYTIDLGGKVFGVIYYIAILPEYRGHGYSRILLASSEEALTLLSADYLVATISGENKLSIRLFESMDYSIFPWQGFSKICGSKAMETLRMATCGYEDDLVAVKPNNGEEIFPHVCEVKREKARRWWRSVCLKPWLDLRRLIDL